MLKSDTNLSKLHSTKNKSTLTLILIGVAELRTEPVISTEALEEVSPAEQAMLDAKIRQQALEACSGHIPAIQLPPGDAIQEKEIDLLIALT